MKRKYSYNLDAFCYICGSFTPTAQRQSINDCVWSAYFADFKIKLRDQDEAWVPHKVCTSCVETLRSWSHGKDNHLPFGIPVIWREHIDHVADGYFCMVNAILPQYPNFFSSFERPVPHIVDGPKPVFNYLPYLEDDAFRYSSTSTDDDMPVDSFSKSCRLVPLPPSLFDQAEINDLIRDLNLPK